MRLALSKKTRVNRQRPLRVCHSAVRLSSHINESLIESREIPSAFPSPRTDDCHDAHFSTDAMIDVDFSIVDDICDVMSIDDSHYCSVIVLETESIEQYTE